MSADPDDGIPILTDVVPPEPEPAPEAALAAPVLVVPATLAPVVSLATLVPPQNPPPPLGGPPSLSDFDTFLSKTAPLSTLEAQMVKSAPEVEAAPPSPPSSLPPTPSSTSFSPPPPLPALPLQALSETSAALDHEALAAQIERDVLEKLHLHIDPLLESRLKETLTSLLEQVLAGMNAELQLSAQRIVRDAVAQAVAKELAKLPLA